MNSSFRSGNRTALSMARKRTTALAAVGLSGAVAVCILSLPGNAQAQKSGSPRVPVVPRGQKPLLPPVQTPSPRPVAGVPLAGSRDVTLREALIAYQRQLASGVNGPNVGTVQAYMDALAHRDAMPALPVKTAIGGGSTGGGGQRLFASRVNIGSTKGPWEFVGPQSLNNVNGQISAQIGNAFERVAGRINAVAFDPFSSVVSGNTTAPEVFYVATSNGGVWRYNSAANIPVPTAPANSTPRQFYGVWEPLSDYSFPVLETSAIAVHPTRNNILYAGTGDYPGQQGLGYGYGIMRSTDAGKTWLNIGNGNPGVTVGTVPPVTPTTPLNPPIMEGTSVSSITIDPVDPNIVMASTGRGVRPGALWRSTDGGNNWTNVSPNPGNWSKIDYSASAVVGNGPRTYYASCEGVGVFRSIDQGATWRNLSTDTDDDPNRDMSKPPPRFTLPLVYTDSILVAASKLPRQAVRPTDAQGSDILYVVEASRNANDSRQFKSLDKGRTWTEITGLPTTVGTDNNFSAANYSLDLLTATVPVINYLATPDANNNYPTVLEEALYGSGRTFAGARGGVFARTADIPNGDFLYGFNQTTNTASPTFFDQGAQPPFVDISESLGPDYIAHIDQHGSAVSPNDNRRVLTVNDGGVNRFLYTPGYATRQNATSHPYLFLDTSTNNTAWVRDTAPINDLLGLGAFEQADFVNPTTSTTPNNANYYVVGGLYQNQAAYGAITFTGVTPTAPTLAAKPFWRLTPLVASGNNRGIVVNGTRITDTPTQPNTNGVPDGVLPGVRFGYTNSVLYFNPLTAAGRAGNEQFGSTGYRGLTDGSDNWPNARLYWTNDNWANGLDITPDRVIRDSLGRSTNTANATVYIYNSNDPIDTTTQSNWRGEPKPPITRWAFGTAHQLTSPPVTNPPGNSQPSRGPIVSPMAYGPLPTFLAPALPVAYIGTNRLWRFDPPLQATAPLLPGTTAPATPPNQDRGIWRRVGTQQLASGTGTISAIAINESGPSIEGSVAYVGTTNGELWVTTNLTAENGGTLPLPPLTATWTQIAGPGSGNATLPSSPTNPITSISINTQTDPTSATFGDILVGLGGNPTVGGPARVYRATNTLGTARPTFTSQQGQNFASLPDVPVNAITRDPDDPTNTLFVATDVGVFASTNAGSTWSNATAPLGLPNVRCTSIKVVPSTPTTNATPINRFLMVSTYGRGVFRFDLNNLTIGAAEPKLTFTQTFSRSNGLVVVNLTISNSGATAQNVVLTGATLGLTPSDTGTSATNLPLTIGAVGAGQSTTVALRFPDTIGRAGTAVVFKASGTYTLPPFPPGTPGTFDNGPGVRTRLP